MSVKEEIELLVNTKPKHYVKIIKNSPDLLREIEQCAGETLPEKVYGYLYGNTRLCPSAKFKSVTEGYVFCGRATSCKCARDSVSQKVSDAKQQYTAEEKVIINQKRVTTNLNTYGVGNTGQTQHAKNKHSEFYEDQTNIDTVVLQVKATKLKNHGNPNYNNIEKIKNTVLSDSFENYRIKKFPEKQLTVLKDKAELTKLYKTMSIEEIASFCQVHLHTVYRYLTELGIRLPYKSTYEQEIVNFLNSVGITNIVRNSRKILPSKKEIDLFLPDFNVAIEYNGIYWHHEEIPHITKTYHYDKFHECNKQGIQLLTIFSNVWDQNKELVKKMILHKLNVDCTKKVFARKCKIKDVSLSDSKSFLIANHIQGFVSSGIRIGLYSNDELVALMTFSKPRLGIGKQDLENTYELVRYSTSVTVVGGASKILAEFARRFPGVTILSYSSNEWSSGGMYSTLGFTLDKEVLPSYWYFNSKDHKLLHRFNFAKHRLVQLGHPKELTESQITKSIGLLKLWDCGKRRWVLEPKY